MTNLLSTNPAKLVARNSIVSLLDRKSLKDYSQEELSGKEVFAASLAMVLQSLAIVAIFGMSAKLATVFIPISPELSIFSGRIAFSIALLSLGAITLASASKSIKTLIMTGNVSLALIAFFVGLY